MGVRLASLPTRSLPLPSYFCPCVPSRAWPMEVIAPGGPFPARVPGLSWPPHTKPHSASQTLLRRNYYRDNRSKLIFQLLHSCSHGDGPNSITCLCSDRFQRRRAGGGGRVRTTKTGVGRERRREHGRGRPPRDRERQKHRDPETERDDPW